MSGPASREIGVAVQDVPPRPPVRIMGILNVTPDSFSDGGRFFTPAAIAEQAGRLVADGADILDVGGESSRPGAQSVPLADELDRVLPTIEAIRRHHSVPISVDTTKAEVARQAIGAGANIVNDISGLRADPEMVRVVRETGVEVVLMHMLGTPRTMQDAPAYDDVIRDIASFLRERTAWAMDQGVRREAIIVDPGIGFGKTVTHNLSIFKHLSAFQDLGFPLLIGHSRKAFIGKVLGLEVGDRDLATAVLSGYCANNGAAIIRVHDVAGTAQALRLAEAIRSAP